MSENTTQCDTDTVYYDEAALISKERKLIKTLHALESMLKIVQDLRTKVNFERTQLITLIEMARGGECEMTIVEPEATRNISISDNPPVDPLLILDRLYNGEFCMSEEEDEDDDDDEGEEFQGHDDFGSENVEW